MESEDFESKIKFDSDLEWFINEKLPYNPPQGIYNYNVYPDKNEGIESANDFDSSVLNEFDNFILYNLLNQEPNKIVNVLKGDNLSRYHLVQPIRNSIQRLYWELEKVFSNTDEGEGINEKGFNKLGHEIRSLPPHSKEVAFSWYKAAKNSIDVLIKTYHSIDNFLNNGDHYHDDQCRYMNHFSSFLKESVSDARTWLEKLEKKRKHHSSDENIKIRNGLEHQMNNLAKDENYEAAVVVRDMIKRFNEKVVFV